MNGLLLRKGDGMRKGERGRGRKGEDGARTRFFPLSPSHRGRFFYNLRKWAKNAEPRPSPPGQTKLGYGDEDAPARNRYMGALRDDELVDDINQVILWTQSEQFRRTNKQKIGIVGYCVGGRITYLAATSCSGLSAASCYYPGRTLLPFGDGPAPIDLTSQIKIPVMGNFGGQDANPSPEDMATIEAKLKGAGVTYDFKSYPDAGHGFNCDERGSYHEASAQDALTRTLGWFDKYVKH